MELHACIEGIKKAMRHPAFNKFNHIVVHSDSLYVVGNHKTALFSWSKNKWRNRYGKPVDNADLWDQLHYLYAQKYYMLPLDIPALVMVTHWQ